MIEAAVADVVGPSVAADGPDALLDQLVGADRQVAGLGRLQIPNLLFQNFNALALLFDFLLRLLRGGENRRNQLVPDGRSQAGEQLLGICRLLVDRDAHAEGELGGVFKQGVGPCRAAPVFD